MLTISTCRYEIYQFLTWSKWLLLVLLYLQSQPLILTLGECRTIVICLADGRVNCTSLLCKLREKNYLVRVSLSCQALSCLTLCLKMHHSFWATRRIYRQMLCCVTMHIRANSHLTSTWTANTADLSLDTYKHHVGLESHAKLSCCTFTVACILTMRLILSWINLLVPWLYLSPNTRIVWSGFTFPSRTRTVAVMSCQSLLQNLPQRSLASETNLPKTLRIFWKTESWESPEAFKSFKELLFLKLLSLVTMGFENSEIQKTTYFPFTELEKERIFLLSVLITDCC